MGYLNWTKTLQPDLPRLREARYLATCYLEHHPGIYRDVYDQLRGLLDPIRDEAILAAAALYTAVVHCRPEEEEVRAQFGNRICDLLLVTTINPDFSPEQRMEAIEASFPDMDREARILMLAVLKAYFRSDIQAYMSELGNREADLVYCCWLEKLSDHLKGDCSELRDRIHCVTGYYRRMRGVVPISAEASWRQMWRLFRKNIS